MKGGRVHPRVLLVEGKDERLLLPYLLEQSGVSWPKGNEPVHIKAQDGVNSLLKAGAIEAELKASGLEALGILVDADDDAHVRWAGVRARLLSSMPDLPELLDPGGIVRTPNGLPRVGVWIMPDNVSAGMLETMLLALRDDDASLHDHVRGSIARARELGAPCRVVHEAKAQLHTWLAWQDPPGCQMHVGVEKGLLKPTSALTAGFVAWFRRLFGV